MLELPALAVKFKPGLTVTVIVLKMEHPLDEVPTTV
jgi:hypothetical protein